MKAKRWIPLFIIFLLFLSFYLLRLDTYFSFSYLQDSHEFIKTWVSHHFFLAILMFGGTYILVTATSLPIAAFLTILGGFLFGPFISVLIIDLCATLGATLLFLSVTTTFGEILQQKATPWVKKMEKGFKKNAFSYLLFLRLVPLFPFWVVTLVPALLGVSLRNFFFATLIGIIPGTFVYALLGNGLGALLEKGQTPDLHIIFRPEIFIPLCGLALFSIIPLIYKRIKRDEKTKR